MKTKVSSVLILILSAKTAAVFPQDKPDAVELSDVLVLKKELIDDQFEHDRIRKQLEQRISVNYRHVSLPKVIDDLQQKLGVRILVRQAALDDAGISPEAVQVTLRRDDVPGRVVLNRVLETKGLTWHLFAEGLRIIPQDLAADYVFARVYALADLVDWIRDSRGTSRRDRFGRFVQPETFEPSPLERLQNLIELKTNTTWEDYDGTGGTVSQVGANLVITQTEAGHREIRDLLDRLRQVIEKSRSGQAWLVPANGYGDPLNKRVYEKLRQKLTVDFDQTPLTEFLVQLTERTGVRFEVNLQSLDDAGVPSNEPITVHAEGVSLAAVLEEALDDLNLEVYPYDGLLLVLTVDLANEALTTVVYDTRDLFEAGFTYDELFKMIRQETPRGMWELYDGVPHENPFELGRFLFVSQTLAAHSEVAGLLAGLRRTLADRKNRDAEEARQKSARNPVCRRTMPMSVKCRRPRRASIESFRRAARHRSRCSDRSIRTHEAGRPAARLRPGGSCVGRRVPAGRHRPAF